MTNRRRTWPRRSSTAPSIWEFWLLTQASRPSLKSKGLPQTGWWRSCPLVTDSLTRDELDWSDFAREKLIGFDAVDQHRTLGHPRLRQTRCGRGHRADSAQHPGCRRTGFGGPGCLRRAGDGRSIGEVRGYRKRTDRTSHRTHPSRRPPQARSPPSRRRPVPPEPAVVTSRAPFNSGEQCASGCRRQRGCGREVRLSPVSLDLHRSRPSREGDCRCIRCR